MFCTYLNWIKPALTLGQMTLFSSSSRNGIINLYLENILKVLELFERSSKLATCYPSHRCDPYRRCDPSRLCDPSRRCDPFRLCDPSRKCDMEICGRATVLQLRTATGAVES
ncbi:hypothetical protein AVEN_25317-1 [Araneus ventricosus]|uniref:Uncharacterized protein n=1 Tax=Araneus ventricosus TaxID=182803 RepID=A0A4Y2IRE4_ARAVE|nr:hypothetical protein AVEN_25317-1 [Araneus ventricosus]